MGGTDGPDAFPVASAIRHCSPRSGSELLIKDIPFMFHGRRLPPPRRAAAADAAATAAEAAAAPPARRGPAPARALSAAPAGSRRRAPLRLLLGEVPAPAGCPARPARPGGTGGGGRGGRRRLRVAVGGGVLGRVEVEPGGHCVRGCACACACACACPCTDAQSPVSLERADGGICARACVRTTRTTRPSRS